VNIPYGPCGKLSVMWTPMAGPEDAGDPPEINDPSELIGKPWTAKIEIKEVVGLPLSVDLAHIEYTFFNQSGVKQAFQTLSVECEGANQRSPQLSYECVHHIPKVTQEFVDFLTEPMEFHLFVSPVAKIPTSSVIGTANAKIVSALKGEAMPTVEELLKKNAALEAEVATLKAEIARLKGDSSIPASKLAGAQAADAAVNG
jgi:hypothetical protein